MNHARTEHGFDHVALLYEGEDDFVARTAPFVLEGVARGEPVMVVTSARKCDRLAAELDGAEDGVEFLDMAEVGRNPACILPVWRDFADRNPDRPIRGIGEPVWPDRRVPELDECLHHESLLNLAFEDGPSLELICPYDAVALDAELIERACRTHPRIRRNGHAAENPAYLPPRLAPGPFEGELSPAPADTVTLHVDGHDLFRLRGFVRSWATRAGLPEGRAQDLTAAVHELACNSLRHGGGRGTLRAWRDDEAVICEMRDAGRIEEPLAGRCLPEPGVPTGRGLWLVNHLCDLVQIRSGPGGSVFRVRMELADAER